MCGRTFFVGLLASSCLLVWSHGTEADAGKAIAGDCKKAASAVESALKKVLGHLDKSLSFKVKKSFLGNSLSLSGKAPSLDLKVSAKGKELGLVLGVKKGSLNASVSTWFGKKSWKASFPGKPPKAVSVSFPCSATSCSAFAKSKALKTLAGRISGLLKSAFKGMSNLKVGNLRVDIQGPSLKVGAKKGKARLSFSGWRIKSAKWQGLKASFGKNLAFGKFSTSFSCSPGKPPRNDRVQNRADCGDAASFQIEFVGYKKIVKETAENKKRLKDLADQLLALTKDNQRKNCKAVVWGHVSCTSDDHMGNPGYHRTWSLGRAEAVVAYLKDHHAAAIKGWTIETKGGGYDLNYPVHCVDKKTGVSSEIKGYCGYRNTKCANPIEVWKAGVAASVHLVPK